MCAVKTVADLAWQLFKERFIETHKTCSGANMLPAKLMSSLDAASARKLATPTRFVQGLQDLHNNSRICTTLRLANGGKIE